MDLSIIIVNYNTRKLVQECVNSIVKCKGNINLEVIIVDNGSLQKIQKSNFIIHNDKFKVVIIENETNLGFSKANNQGIRIAKGKYILLLNSDTIVKKDALQKLLRFAMNSHNAGVIGPTLLNIDGTKQGSVFHFPTLAGAIKQYWLRQPDRFSLYIPKGDKPTIVDSVVGAAFLITPAARQKVGLLNEKYFMYFEDLDYCKRVWESGLKVYYLPAAKVIHYHGASGKNVVKPEFQWKRLIPSSKIYHGLLKHYSISFVMWTGQKIFRI